MRGAPTDNNATLFAQGYMGVLKAGFDSGKYVNQHDGPELTWRSSARIVGQREVIRQQPMRHALSNQQQYTAEIADQRVNSNY